MSPGGGARDPGMVSLGAYRCATRLAGGGAPPDGAMVLKSQRRSWMVNQTARLTFLRLIGEHEDEWGWYQFERAFPPGWFTDEAPDTRAMDILNQLEMDGLVTSTPGEPQRKY